MWIQGRQLNKIDRLEKVYEKADKKIAANSTIQKLKSKQKISKKDNQRLEKEVQKIINKELRESEEAEIKEAVSSQNLKLSSGAFHYGIRSKDGKIIIYAGGNDYAKIKREVREANYGNSVIVIYKEKNIADVYAVVAKNAGEKGMVTPDWMPEHIAMAASYDGKIREVYNPLELYYNGILTEKELNTYIGYSNTLKYVEVAKKVGMSVYIGYQASKYYGTEPLYSITKLNEAGTKLLIQTPNGVGVVQVTPKGYIEAYGRVNGKGVYYSSSPVSSATKSLLQIGNTTGYDLASRINGTPQKLLTANYETYYRTISQEHYDILKSTGKIPAGYNGETFISPSLSYVQRYDYGGVTLEFKLNPGTMNELMNIGVKSKNQISGIMGNPNYNYSKLPNAPKGWGNNHAMFKLETTIQKNPIIKDPYNVNIGLGREEGKALNIFNDNIIDYKVIGE